MHIIVLQNMCAFCITKTPAYFVNAHLFPQNRPVTPFSMFYSFSFRPMTRAKRWMQFQCVEASSTIFFSPHKYFLCPHYIFIHLYAKKPFKNTTMNFKFFHKIPNQQNNSTFKEKNSMYFKWRT